MRDDYRLEQFQNKEYKLYRKYGLMKMSFDLWGAIKQLDWAVFAIEI